MGAGTQQDNSTQDEGVVMPTRRRATAMLSGAALVAGLGCVAAGVQPATAVPARVGSVVSSAGADAADGRYVVLAAPAKTAAVASALRSKGATVTSVNSDVGLIAVSSTASGFRAKAASVSGVQGVAADVSIGSDPKPQPWNGVEREGRTSPAVRKNASGKPGSAADPLDSNLWGQKMINVPQARKHELGDKRVRVGIIDTGIQADHPDLVANVDRAASRNFVTDIPAIDGPCEHKGCVDPATVDDNGHGTHVAGTVAASLNGFGLSGIAPKVTLVNLRAGQDAGFFFLGPVVNALTHAARTGIDVVNMSFYVDPWLYNCPGGAPQDGAPAAADQKVIIESMMRALRFADKRGVTLVAAAGNDHDNLAAPRTDVSSPDYDNPANDWDNAPYPRTINGKTCLDLPLEGPNVIGVTSVGPSGTKSDFSNYTTDLRSGEIEVAAPGGWFRDGLGTSSYQTPQNMILSTMPLVALQNDGYVDAKGEITEAGRTNGVIKECTPRPVKNAARCGYYGWLQGTSMAAPHATGVVALAISAHGKRTGHHDFGMSPKLVKRLLMGSATEHACPAGGVRSYEPEGRSAEFTAKCVGTPSFNGFYGAGIVNALGVVKRW